jgi:hypothetical protein
MKIEELQFGALKRLFNFHQHGIPLTPISRNQMLFIFGHRKHRIALKLKNSFCEDLCSSVAQIFSVNFGLMPKIQGRFPHYKLIQPTKK